MKTCSKCGHSYEPPTFCATCKHELICGKVSEECSEPGCGERRAPHGVSLDYEAGHSRTAVPRQAGLGEIAYPTITAGKTVRWRDIIAPYKRADLD